MATGATLLFLRVAVQCRYLTKEQVNQVVQIQSERAEDGKPATITDILLEERILKPAQVQALVKAVRYMEVRAEDKIFGRLALQNGFVGEEVLKRCQEIQKERYERTKAVPSTLVDILVEKSHLTIAQADSIRNAQRRLRHMTPTIADDFSSVPVPAQAPESEAEASPGESAEIYCAACGAISHGEEGMMGKPWVCPVCLETVVALRPNSARIRKKPAEDTWHVVTKEDATHILDTLPPPQPPPPVAVPNNDRTEFVGATARPKATAEKTEVLDPRTLAPPDEDATGTDFEDPASPAAGEVAKDSPSSVVFRALGARPPRAGGASRALPAAKTPPRGSGAAAPVTYAPQETPASDPVRDEASAGRQFQFAPKEAPTDSEHEAEGLTNLDIALPGRAAGKLRVIATLLEVAAYVLAILGVAIGVKVYLSGESSIAGLPKIAVATLFGVLGLFAFLIAQGVALLCRSQALIDHAVRHRR